jgi:serine/threonine protein kinase
MIGAGMLGRVYAARHKSGRTDVEAAYAIKVVRRKWWDSPEVMRIVRREAFVGCRVRHPNVVPVLDARLDSPPHFLVMPRLWGVTLEALVDRHPPMRPAQALRIARQIAEGLAAIDATCGMTHGDVKPHNVFISANGKVTLLDLGFAGRHHERLQQTSAATFTASARRSTKCSPAGGRTLPPSRANSSSWFAPNDRSVCGSCDQNFPGRSHRLSTACWPRTRYVGRSRMLR